MKYDVTHICGCTETVDLFDKGDRRERRIAALESQPCAECRAAEVNSEEGFAPLEGTPKQIAWAGEIRKRMLAEISAFGDKALAEEGHPESEREQVRAMLAESLRAVREVGSAAWFIDRRDLSPLKAYRAALAIAEGK